uniref:Uncharacterized protein n=1 Tax=Rhodnius prolixus TaxID=13249 RepID=T1I267_RHOPR
MSRDLAALTEKADWVLVEDKLSKESLGMPELMPDSLTLDDIDGYSVSFLLPKVNNNTGTVTVEVHKCTGVCQITSGSDSFLPRSVFHRVKWPSAYARSTFFPDEFAHYCNATTSCPDLPADFPGLHITSCGT